MSNALLSTTFFGPVQWYQKVYRSDMIYIDETERFIKQSYRNRCIIATANGVQSLTVPIIHSHDSHSIKDIKISSHGNWKHLHWQAIRSAYGDSPFFQYYADDIQPFFSKDWEYLFDFNNDIFHTICQLLDIEPKIINRKNTAKQDYIDFRTSINPKHPACDSSFEPRRYYQVFEQKHGFIPNLSILDLLFCMGPESVFYL